MYKHLSLLSRPPMFPVCFVGVGGFKISENVREDVCVGVLFE